MNLQALRERKHITFVIIEIVMMNLLIINLSLIIIDWLYGAELVRNFLDAHIPETSAWYDEWIHSNFVLIDLGFVTLFLIEFFVQWGEAIWHKRHKRWYYYPILHWYDLAGCIPIGTFRFLRLLRFISILNRLHRMGVIDLTDNPVFDAVGKYGNILIEEVTDRVVVRILRNVRDEVEHGTPVIDQIIDDVLTPRKEMVVNWLSYRIQKIAEHNNARYRDDIRGYVDRRIEEAVEQNQEIGTISKIPVFGRQASTMIERATADIVFNVINGALEDLGSEDNRVLIEDLTDIVFDDVIHSKDSASLNKVLSDLIVQSLDVVIAKVKIKQWKHDNLRENEEMLKKELRLNLKKMYEGN